MPELPIITFGLAFLVPLGYALIAVGGLTETRARHAALSLVAAMGLAFLGYTATGFALQFGGIGLVYGGSSLGTMGELARAALEAGGQVTGNELVGMLVGLDLVQPVLHDVPGAVVEGFTIGIRTLGDGRGFEDSTLVLGRIVNNRIGLDIRCATDTA